MKAPPCFEDSETKRIIRRICEEHSIDDELLKDLCDLIAQFSGSGRRFGVDAEIAGAIDRFISRSSQA